MLSLSLLLETIAVAIVSLLILNTYTRLFNPNTVSGYTSYSRHGFCIHNLHSLDYCLSDLLPVFANYARILWSCKSLQTAQILCQNSTKNGKFSRTRIGWKGRKSSKLAKLKLDCFLPTKQAIRHSIFSSSCSAFRVLFYIILLLALMPCSNAKPPNNGGSRLPMDPPGNPHMDSPFPFRQRAMQERTAARVKASCRRSSLNEDAVVAARQKKNSYRARRKAEGKDRASEARNKAQWKARERLTSLDFSSIRLNSSSDFKKNFKSNPKLQHYCGIWIQEQIASNPLIALLVVSLKMLVTKIFGPDKPCLDSDAKAF